MSNLTVQIMQNQAAMLLAQAQASLNLAAQALQQAIAAAQAAGATTVTLTAQALQGIQAQLTVAIDTVERGRVLQRQMTRVRIRGDIDIMVMARQMQIANILARVRANLSATLRTIQGLLTMAQTMGGTVTVGLASAQQILSLIQAAVNAVVQASALQMQNILITATAPQA